MKNAQAKSCMCKGPVTGIIHTQAIALAFLELVVIAATWDFNYKGLYYKILITVSNKLFLKLVSYYNWGKYVL